MSESFGVVTWWHDDLSARLYEIELALKLAALAPQATPIRLAHDRERAQPALIKEPTRTLEQVGVAARDAAQRGERVGVHLFGKHTRV